MHTPAVQRLLAEQRAQAQNLQAAAWYERLYEALVRGLALLPQETWTRLVDLFDLDTLWALLVILGLWAGAHLVGAGFVGDVALIAYGVYSAGTSIFVAGSHLWKFAKGAIGATSETDLDQAGAHFAAAVGEIGFTVLEGFLGGKLFRAARSTIRAVAPAPGAIRGRLGKLAELVKRQAEKLSETERERLQKLVETSGGVGLSEGAKDAGNAASSGWPWWAKVGAGGLVLYGGYKVLT